MSKFIASELKLVDSPSATYIEIADKMGIDKAIVAARLSDMKKKGYVRSSNRGRWEIIFQESAMFLTKFDKGWECHNRQNDGARAPSC